jgi:23S rRNA (cytidine1920-2'-O)/16S rRNA (cytidine1409-2'-O)-methyltransferase
MSEDCPYVGRGGLKLRHALDRFEVETEGVTAADLGSHVGGFVDCLLKAGARKVYSVDTSYGTLAWELRNDPRVVVMERQNALHVELPEKVALVTVDVGWTPQRMILPHAVSLLAGGGRAISLLKPQYESRPEERERGVVKPDCVDDVVRRTIDELASMGIEPEAVTESPVVGDKRTNREFFLLLDPATSV